MERTNEPIKILTIVFKNSNTKIKMVLDGILKTEIVFAKPYNIPILIITYRGFKQEYFSFLHNDAAQELKNAIDEKRDFIYLKEWGE